MKIIRKHSSLHCQQVSSFRSSSNDYGKKIREREFSTVVLRDDQHNKAMALSDDAKTLSDGIFNIRASSKLIFCADIHTYQQEKKWYHTYQYNPTTEKLSLYRLVVTSRTPSIRNVFYTNNKITAKGLKKLSFSASHLSIALLFLVFSIPWVRIIIFTVISTCKFTSCGKLQQKFINLTCLPLRHTAKISNLLLYAHTTIDLYHKHQS